MIFSPASSPPPASARRFDKPSNSSTIAGVKLTWKQIDSFVKKPDPAARVILVYGPDDGLMRERAKTMGLAVVADYNDPFNVAVLENDALANDPARLPDEAFAISMMGGNRLIRVENASDKITKIVEEYLANPSAHALVILEAGELPPKSKLRALCEKNSSAAAVPCYVEDERDLARLIREILGEAKINIQPDAVSWLAANIAGDRRRARREIEKLIVFKGMDKTPVTLADVQACCGEAGAQGLDDLVFGAASGNSAAALRAWQKLLGEDVAFMSVLRALQNHFRRLHITRARIESGESAEEAMKKLSPPVFFKQADAFRSQISRWSLPSIESTLAKLAGIEAQCKQTAMPPETLCAQAILGISKSAR